MHLGLILNNHLTSDFKNLHQPFTIRNIVSIAGQPVSFASRRKGELIII